jgi:uncharacterized coiled-coil protein SlyX
MGNEKDKIIELEIALAHLQRQFDVLNAVVTDQAMQMDRASKRIDKWEQAVQRLKNTSETAADSVEEKPPHY